MGRVLVIDNEMGYRNHAKRILGGDGHSVETAPTLHSAAAIQRQFKPDIVLAEWLSQSLDPELETVFQLTADRPSVKTILMSGYPEEILEDRVKEQRVFALLPKPFEADDLRDVVNRALDSTHEAEKRQT